MFHPYLILELGGSDFAYSGPSLVMARYVVGQGDLLSFCNAVCLFDSRMSSRTMIKEVSRVARHGEHSVSSCQPFPAGARRRLEASPPWKKMKMKGMMKGEGKRGKDGMRNLKSTRILRQAQDERILKNKCMLLDNKIRVVS
jgi:hypothetical protein